MAKIERIGTIKEFLSGEWKDEIKQKADSFARISAIAATTATVATFVVPSSAVAYAFADGSSNMMKCPPKNTGAFGSGDTFLNLHSSIMNMFDAGVVLIIIFAGACWALGHRSKALEQLIGVSCGLVLARHAIDIRDFLKCI
jgi:hypothetical protein